MATTATTNTTTTTTTTTSAADHHLVEEIQEQFLLCHLCRGPYKRPKNLPCLHTFCLKCIEAAHESEVSSKKYGDPREITCPICFKKAQLPVGGVRNLTDNFLVVGLAELVEKQKSSSAKEKHRLICDICREENTKTPEVNNNNNTSGSESNESKPVKVRDSKGKRRSFMSLDMTVLSEKHYKVLSRAQNENKDKDGGSDDDSEDNDDDDDDDEDDTKDGSVCNGAGKKDETQCNGGREVKVNGVAGSSRAESERSGSQQQHNKMAVSKCLECNKMLCPCCIKKHQTMKVTSRHSMIDVETEKDVECKEHPGEPVRFYCDKCDTCVCVLCAFNSHREHDVENFSDAASKHRDPLKSLIFLCQEKVAEFEEIFENLSSLEGNLRETEDKIRETSSMLVMQIRQQERQLIERLRSDVDARIFDYIEHKKDLKLQMDTLQNTCCLAKIVLESNDVEMLLLKKEVEEKLTTLSLVGLKELPPEGVLKRMVEFTPGQANLGELVTVVVPAQGDR